MFSPASINLAGENCICLYRINIYLTSLIFCADILSGPVKEKFDTWNADFFGITPVSLLYNTTAPNKNEVTQEVRDFYFGKDNKLVTPDMTVEMNMVNY